MYQFPNETDTEGGCVCVRAGDVEEIFVPLFQFCCKPETTLKNSLFPKKSILLHLHPGKRFLIEIWREDSDNIEFPFYDIKIIPELLFFPIKILHYFLCLGLFPNSLMDECICLPTQIVGNSFKDTYCVFSLCIPPIISPCNLLFIIALRYSFKMS